MRILRFLIPILLISFYTFADDVTLPTTYSNGGQVTATNLNGNFQAIAQKVNGGLDNDNANTTTGYRFFEIRSSLPAAGTQGRIIFNTADSTLNFDTGSAYNKAVSLNSPSNGDIPYYSSGWTTTTFAAHLPTDLSIMSQTQGDILYFNGVNWVRLAAGTAGQYLESNGAGANPSWGSIATETGTVANGGTISLPSGFTAGQCKWQVGLGDGSSVNGASHPDGVYFVTTVNASRVVTCTAGSVNVESDGTCIANYIITCQK